MRRRELATAAESARAQHAPLTDNQQRALKVRDRELARDCARDYTGKRHRIATANDSEERESAVSDDATRRQSRAP